MPYDTHTASTHTLSQKQEVQCRLSLDKHTVHTLVASQTLTECLHDLYGAFSFTSRTLGYDQGHFFAIGKIHI